VDLSRFQAALAAAQLFTLLSPDLEKIKERNPGGQNAGSLDETDLSRQNMMFDA
jgi:hypothetical protein